MGCCASAPAHPMAVMPPQPYPYPNMQNAPPTYSPTSPMASKAVPGDGDTDKPAEPAAPGTPQKLGTPRPAWGEGQQAPFPAQGTPAYPPGYPPNYPGYPQAGYGGYPGGYGGYPPQYGGYPGYGGYPPPGMYPPRMMGGGMAQQQQNSGPGFGTIMAGTALGMMGGMLLYDAMDGGLDDSGGGDGGGGE